MTMNDNVTLATTRKTYHAIEVVRTERQQVARPRSCLVGGERLLPISVAKQMPCVLSEHLGKVHKFHPGKPRINVEEGFVARLPRVPGRRRRRPPSRPVVQVQNASPVDEFAPDARRVHHWLLPLPLGDVGQAQSNFPLVVHRDPGVPTQHRVAIVLPVGVPADSRVKPGPRRLARLARVVVHEDGPVQHDAPKHRVVQVVQAVPGLVRARVVRDRVAATVEGMFWVGPERTIRVLSDVLVEPLERNGRARCSYVVFCRIRRRWYSN
jgi:hypothetical protein